MKLNKETLRRMENLRDFCDFDTDEGIATLHLHFKNVEAILDSQRSTIGHPVLSEETIERMTENMKLIPVEFDVVFSITVDDYQGYDPEQLLKAYQDGVDKGHYAKRAQKKSANAVSILLAVIGLLLVGVKVLGRQYEWFGPASTITAMFVIGFIEIFSEIFFEESVIFFWINVSDFDLYKENFKRLAALQCCDGKGIPVHRLDRKAIFADWKRARKKF